MDWIDELKPGRETDGQLAVSVFGWRTDGKLIYPPEDDQRNKWKAVYDEFGCPSFLPKWSTDPLRVFDAHDVSVAVKDGKHHFQLTYYDPPGTELTGFWFCEIVIGRSTGSGKNADRQMAIVQAALRACKAVKRG